MARLPIDEILPDVRASLLEGARRVIVEAPPGAGKTTRLPAALLDTPFGSKKILVSEPRRIAARLSALRVAEEHGQAVGQTIGYQVRFDDKTQKSTRLIYMTEGLLLRRLLDDDSLSDVSVVVLDEVHERSSDLDVALALLIEAQKKNQELRVVAMSATLDADALLQYLGPDTKRHTSEGRSFPVTVKYDPKEDDRPLSIRIRSAVKQARSLAGDILVFLPGAAEIRAAEEALRELGDLKIDTLHGDMKLEDQSRVVRNSGGDGRVILATNIAESSLTLAGVTTVIDTGLARGAIYDPWAAVSRLMTHEVSQARAIQRAGRAGRVAEGQALRLYTSASFGRRPAQDTPELLRCDFSEVLLGLARKQAAGGLAPREYRFLSAPSEQIFLQAEKLLTQLGALADGRITPLGLVMSQLSLAPRLARSVVEGGHWEVPARACLAAALLSERDILTSARGRGQRDVQFGDCDIKERIELFEQLADSRFDRRLGRDLSVDVNTARQVENIARQSYAHLSRGLSELPELAAKSIGWARNWEDQLSAEDHEFALGRVLLAGFSDRVALRRGSGREVILENGTQATLSESSCLVHGSLLLAAAMDAPFGKARKPVVRMASRLEADWLMEFDANRIEANDEYIYNTEKDRVEAISRLSFGKVILDETRQNARPGPEAAPVLTQAALQKGPLVYDPEAKLEALSVRLSIVLEHMKDRLSDLDEGDNARISLWAKDEDSLRRSALLGASELCASLSELATQNLSQALLDQLPSEVSRALQKYTPAQVALRGGLSVPVHYEKERPPWIEARLQNFFSMLETPTICEGRLPLSIHLLAPNHRAVQVTSDLAGFWERHYPELRKQLMRKYPKHLWPEDGRTAAPPSPGRIR